MLHKEVPLKALNSVTDGYLGIFQKYSEEVFARALSSDSLWNRHWKEKVLFRKLI